MIKLNDFFFFFKKKIKYIMMNDVKCWTIDDKIHIYQ